MKKVALYIHIPFCARKCLYCDFKSFPKAEGFMEDYVDALIKEIKNTTKGYKIRSLFIGGGTPSYLDEKSLLKLMDSIKVLDYEEGAEKTIECNPGTVNENKFKIIKSGGINRISFGLQSTKNELLRNIGRIHTYEEFKENYYLARKLGFNNINIDMMFGLPNQKLKDYEESLIEICNLSPEHISAYSLIIEEGTPFYNMYNKDLLILPNEDEEREMYRRGKEILKLNGYHQYEISNFAKANKECFHNKIYWKCEEYIGVGIAASSFIDERRYRNISNIKEYINRINNNERVIEEEYRNTEKDDIEEFMFMNLRMINGINENEFKRRFNKDIDDIYRSVIEKHIKNKLLKRENGRIFLTDKGIELSNYVMSDMILD